MSESLRVEYLPSFIKDLKALRSSVVYETVRTLVFEEIPGYTNLNQIRNLKKLKEHDNAYRIRVSDYRVGLTFANGTVTFSRVLHRKEIYRSFP